MTRDDAPALRVDIEGSGARVEVRSGIGFVVPDAVVVQSVKVGAADFNASLRCVSWPVHLSLFRGALPAPASNAIAMSLCESHAEKRSTSRETPAVLLASPTRLRDWGVDAAARAVYPSTSTGDRLDFEECLYLLKGKVGWRITWRFDSQRIAQTAWSEFASMVDATLGWDGAHAPPARVESYFVDEHMSLKPDARSYARELARWVALSGVALDEVAKVVESLQSLVLSDDAPDAPLSDRAIEHTQRAFEVARTPVLRETLHALRQRVVSTSRDLRGLKVFLEEVARLRGVLAPAPVRCDCGATVMPEEFTALDERLLSLAQFRQMSAELDGLTRAARPWLQASQRSSRWLSLQCTLAPIRDAVDRHLEVCPLERGDDAPFGAFKVGCRVERQFAPPPEIERIERGGYVEFIGFFVNEGTARWCGFDLNRGVLVKVLRSSGRFLDAVQSPVAPSESEYVRASSVGGEVVRESITVRALTERDLLQVVAIANVLWASAEPFTTAMTDSHNHLELRDGAEQKSFGGVVGFTGPARRLEELLNSLSR